MNDKLFWPQLMAIIGTEDIQAFINKWMLNGGNFNTLYQHLILRGMEVRYQYVWKKLRPYLTVPYESKDQFLYKWDSLAKTKGFDDITKLMNNYADKYTSKEIADELGIGLSTAEKLRRRALSKNRGISPVKRKRVTHKDKQGFHRSDYKAQWKARLEALGHTTIREAVYYLRRKGKTFKQIAQALGVTDRCLRYRMKLAKINPKEYKRRRGHLIPN